MEHKDAKKGARIKFDVGVAGLPDPPLTGTIKRVWIKDDIEYVVAIDGQTFPEDGAQVHVTLTDHDLPKMELIEHSVKPTIG